MSVPNHKMWRILIAAALLPLVSPFVYLTTAAATNWTLNGATMQYEDTMVGFGTPATIAWNVRVVAGTNTVCVAIVYPVTAIMVCNGIAGGDAQSWTLPAPLLVLECSVDSGNQPFVCGIPQVVPCQRMGPPLPQIVLPSDLDALTAGLIATYFAAAAIAALLCRAKADPAVYGAHGTVGV